MAKLTRVKIVNRLVERLKKAERLRRDTCFHDPAVVSLAFPGNQAAFFQAVEKARHVWVVRDHAFADAAAGQTLGPGPAKNAEDIVLRAGKCRRFQELIRFLAEGVGGLQEGHENAALPR